MVCLITKGDVVQYIPSGVEHYYEVVDIASGQYEIKGLTNRHITRCNTSLLIGTDKTREEILFEMNVQIGKSVQRTKATRKSRTTR